MGSVYFLKRRNTWVIEYKLDGKNILETIGKRDVVTKTMAKKRLRDIERKIERGEYEKNEIPILKGFAKDYINHVRDVKKNRAWSRDEIALSHFTRLYGHKKLSDIKASHIDDYKRHRLEIVKEGTVNRELEVVRAMFNQAKNWERFYGDNPVSKAGLIRVNNQKERILTDEEEQRLLDASSETLRPIIICALHTGMRKGEIIGLKWENVDLTNDVITLNHETTKSKKTRRIPINASLKELLRGLRLRSGGSDFVFNYIDSSGTPKPYLRQDSLNRAFREACKKASIRDLRFHDLRHTSATRMIERGGNVVAVSKILGHADIKTTMRYAHPEDSLKDAVESLSIGSHIEKIVKS